MPALHLPRKKTVVVAVGILAALFLAWLLTAYQSFYNVHTQNPERADAVVMLGGASKERLLATMMLRSELNATYLVLSNTDTAGNASADQYCDTHSNRQVYADVICFTPDPMDTRGEAAALGELVAEYHWSNVTVVTSTYHIERAGTLMRQCLNTNVTMAQTHPDLSTWQWLRRFVIETGGLLTVLASPECSAPVD